MNANLAALLYLVAGVLFILSLRGLSSPASSRQGNFLGMAGMAIAVATTLAAHPSADGVGWVLVVLGVAIGGSIGAVIARRVPNWSRRFTRWSAWPRCWSPPVRSTRPRPSTLARPATFTAQAWLKCRSASRSAR
jgi:hypothetical protein